LPVTGGSPKATSAGRATSVPPPPMAVRAPAATPASRTRRCSTTPTASRDGDQPTRLRPAWRPLAVGDDVREGPHRAREPSVHGGVVALPCRAGVGMSQQVLDLGEGGAVGERDRSGGAARRVWGDGRGTLQPGLPGQGT